MGLERIRFRPWQLLVFTWAVVALLLYFAYAAMSSEGVQAARQYEGMLEIYGQAVCSCSFDTSYTGYSRVYDHYQVECNGPFLMLRD